MSIEERVKKIIAEQLEIHVNEVRNNASFIADLRADDEAMTNLPQALELEFDIEIPDDVAENMATVQDAIDCVNARQG